MARTLYSKVKTMSNHIQILVLLLHQFLALYYSVFQIYLLCFFAQYFDDFSFMALVQALNWAKPSPPHCGKFPHFF